jgi:dihydrofolate reductase
MRIEAIAVTSRDGKITNSAGDSHSWISEEDQQLFSRIKSKFPLIVMGRKTYEAIKPVLKLSPNVLRVVLTHTPEVYVGEVVPNELEFMSASPTTLIDRLERRGYTSMLLAGGAHVYTEFIQERLVDRLHITVEPIVFDGGLPFVDRIDIHDISTLLETKQLNDSGTVYTMYECNK